MNSFRVVRRDDVGDYVGVLTLTADVAKTIRATEVLDADGNVVASSPFPTPLELIAGDSVQYTVRLGIPHSNQWTEGPFEIVEHCEASTFADRLLGAFRSMRGNA